MATQVPPEYQRVVYTSTREVAMNWEGSLIVTAFCLVLSLWLTGVVRRRLSRARVLRRLDEAEWLNVVEKLRSGFAETGTAPRSW